MGCATIKELNEVREIIELKIAEKAALNRTDDDLKNLENHLERRLFYATNDDLANCIEADINFHLAVAKASKNEMLYDIYKSISEQLKKWFHKVYSNTSVLSDSHERHVTLYKSIEAKDSIKALEATGAVS